MQKRQLYLVPAFAVAATVVGMGVASPAAADCNYSGGSTLCSSGTVRGGSAPPQATFDPYPCYGDPTCDYYDNWDPNIYLDLPGIGGGRPGVGGGPIIPGGRPGGGGGRPGRG
ncbi:hypothetical protein [Candidatus Mycolicibacterium alkanivorans]|uniref:Uncharacterized protein n=1 Tax=Candidatus Mycolicibacterium alkanivorans TaxID=2954114 RepID=A0ABS9YU31_9MYCO|nr:hypothetical protein [Candidatus Mycolicibacterium alkanivorans]MCI4674728.1 hypothetical protein [Candidatus Mycolicibacterium alkanivorans]